VVSVNVGERSKPVVLHLEEPIRMVEGLREPQERHGPECREAFFERTRSGGMLGAGTGRSYPHPWRAPTQPRMSLAIRPIALYLGCLGLRLLPTIRCQGVAAGGCSALLSRPDAGST
jgi:hypothetical protein